MQKRKRSPMSKHWCLTLNNPSDDDMPDLALFEYLVLGSEVGDEGTPHWQGYCVFRTRKQFTAVKKVWPRAHLEIRAGSPKQAMDYCKKGGKYKQWGVEPITNSQRMICKWQHSYNLAKKGKLDDIERPMLIRYYHSFKRIHQDNPEFIPHLKGTCGYWFHGPSGCGKSYTAWTKFPGLYDKSLNKWWDGYKGQDTILLDDVGPKQSSWLGYFLKRWADRYSFPAEQKGTTISIRPKRFIVTSQYTIDALFGTDPAECDAITRRFTNVEIRRHDPLWDDIFSEV